VKVKAFNTKIYSDSQTTIINPLHKAFPDFITVRALGGP